MNTGKVKWFNSEKGVLVSLQLMVVRTFLFITLQLLDMDINL